MQTKLSSQIEPRATPSSRHVVQLFIFIAGLMCTMHAAGQSSARSILIELSAEAEEALDNGVKLQFNSRYVTRQPILFFYYRRLAHQHKFEIQRHALSNRYVVRKDDLETPRIFRSVSQAMHYIAAQALVLLEFYHEEQQLTQMRISLNLYSLPGPMRLNAFLSDQWDVDTGWVDWRP